MKLNHQKLDGTFRDLKEKEVFNYAIYMVHAAHPHSPLLQDLDIEN